MYELTERRRNIITGMIALVLVIGAVYVGVAASFGAYDDVYSVKASFDRAGQGLQKGSDVKIRGVNIGKISSVHLVDDRASVTMDIFSSQRIPTSAEAVVRPKTLFGEKFVDIVPCPDPSDPTLSTTETGSCPSEGAGPFYATDGKAAFPNEKTLGGFELERVLVAAYPLLKAINPAELGNVISTLADAGRGLGPEINRTLVNGEKVADVFAAHDADQRKSLADLNTVATQLGVRSDDLVALARSLNEALPTVNSRSTELNQLLVQLGRLSNDAADLVTGNKAYIDEALGPGDAVIQLVYDHRNDVVPLVVGLREYLQTLAQSARIPLGDGSVMAAVKGLTGGQACSFLPCPITASATTSSPAGAAATTTPADASPLAGLVPSLPAPGTNVVTDLFSLLAKGAR